jgi:hypothetical protein
MHSHKDWEHQAGGASRSTYYNASQLRTERGTGSTTTLHAWLRPRRTVIACARRSRMISGYWSHEQQTLEMTVITAKDHAASLAQGLSD